MVAPAESNKRLAVLGISRRYFTHHRHCPSIVPELSPSSAYSRRFPSSESSRKSLSFRVWSASCDVGLREFLRSNPVGDANSSVVALQVASAVFRNRARIVPLLSRESRWGRRPVSRLVAIALRLDVVGTASSRVPPPESITTWAVTAPSPGVEQTRLVGFRRGWFVINRGAFIAACLSCVFIASSSAFTGNQPGHLAVHIAVSDSPAYIEQWTSTPFRTAITIRRIHDVERGKTAYIAFLVTGESAGPAGRSNVDVGVRVLRPDHSVAYSDSSHSRVSRRKDGRIGFTMADPALDFGVELDDPLGTWVIEATAHDRVTGARTTATYDLAVRAPAPQKR